MAIIYRICIDYGVLRLVVGLCGRLTVTAAYFICLQYASEIFPTVLRGRGVGLCEVVGGVAILGSPAIVYLVGYHHTCLAHSHLSASQDCRII